MGGGEGRALSRNRQERGWGLFVSLLFVVQAVSEDILLELPGEDVDQAHGNLALCHLVAMDRPLL
jgi:hypothetical protein